MYWVVTDVRQTERQRRATIESRTDNKLALLNTYNATPARSISYTFQIPHRGKAQCRLCFVFSHFYFLDKPWAQVSSLLPPVLSLNVYRA